jgi:catechol 2,3-dioxygenase-like lactoylglutathione lyase family enzyme
MPRLNLIVLRSPDPTRLASFYAELGLGFILHRHGTGPEHFASESGGAVFEIYPVGKNDGTSISLRLGFEVDDLTTLISRLEQKGVTILSAPAASPWGFRAVVQDWDGHKVELTETPPADF